MTDYWINGLLSEWGRWVCRQNDMGLGFPKEVAFSKERVSGRNRDSDTYIEHTDPDILLVHQVVTKMLPLQHRQLVRIHYVEAGSVKAKSNALKIDRRAYYKTLEHCQLCIGSLLGYLKGAAQDTPTTRATA
jgi:hypothetical protein